AVMRRGRGGSTSSRAARRMPSAGMRRNASGVSCSTRFGTSSANSTSAPASTVVPTVTPREARGHRLRQPNQPSRATAAGGASGDSGSASGAGPGPASGARRGPASGAGWGSVSGAGSVGASPPGSPPWSSRASCAVPAASPSSACASTAPAASAFSVPADGSSPGAVPSTAAPVTLAPPAPPAGPAASAASPSWSSPVFRPASTSSPLSVRASPGAPAAPGGPPRVRRVPVVVLPGPPRRVVVVALGRPRLAGGPRLLGPGQGLLPGACAVHGLRGVPGAPGTPGGLRRLRLVAVVVVVVVPGLPGCGRRPGGVVRVRPAPGSVRLPARASEERHPEVLPYGYCDGMANRTLHGPAPSQYVRTPRRVQCGLHPCSARSGRRVGPWAQHGVADQGDAADPLLLDGAQHLLGHVPAVRDHALPEVEPDERGRGGGAVQQRCRGEAGCPGRPPRPVRPVPRAGSPVRRSRRAAAETGEDQVLPAQHHPLGHTGRAAGVDDEPVVSGARGEAAAGRAGRLG